MVKGSESVLQVGLVVEALGQEIAPELRDALLGLQFTRAGLIEVTPGSYATSLPGVYAAGDLINGGTTAVQGIAEGMAAAAEISRRLGAPVPA